MKFLVVIKIRVKPLTRLILRYWSLNLVLGFIDLLWGQYVKGHRVLNARIDHRPPMHVAHCGLPYIYTLPVQLWYQRQGGTHNYTVPFKHACRPTTRAYWWVLPRQPYQSAQTEYKLIRSSFWQAEKVSYVTKCTGVGLANFCTQWTSLSLKQTENDGKSIWFGVIWCKLFYIFMTVRPVDCILSTLLWVLVDWIFTSCHHFYGIWLCTPKVYAVCRLENSIILPQEEQAIKWNILQKYKHVL